MNKFKNLQILGTSIILLPIVVGVGLIVAYSVSNQSVTEVSEVVEVEEKVEKKVDTVVVVKEVPLPPPPPIVKKPVVVIPPPTPKLDSPKVEIDSVVEIEVKVEPDTTTKV